MKILAIDPSLHELGMCFLINGNIASVGVLKVPKDIKGESACLQMANKFLYFLSTMPQVDKAIIEGQDIYEGFTNEGKKKTPNPNSIRLLSFLSGILTGVLLNFHIDYKNILWVQPSKWKGQIPKFPHHKQIADRFGLKWEPSNTKNPYISVTSECGILRGTDKIVNTDWWNILDAVGIAEWLQNKIKRESFKPF